jgi:asparagine synthase (glutamine-hydrolysing)
MCGICGFIGVDSELAESGNVENGNAENGSGVTERGAVFAEREAALQAMKDRIIHRGPDDEGSYLDDGAALGFRRLSIIDLDCGHQPMTNEDGSIVITFNGEIYNYRELRTELVERGHRFANASDTEVLVHGWEEYGEGLLDRLRGMFAFIIWDTKTQTAFGARDFFGIKPLYYALQGGVLVYASEIKSILAYPGIVPELNHEALEQYLSFQYSALPETFFKGIFKLGPGECFTFRDGELTLRRYFDPLPNPLTVDELKAERADPFDHMVERIKRSMQESVAAHMIADVEVGSLLSSGIDSSYITALYPNERTYTVGFETADGVKYNEISYAEQAAAEMGKSNTSRVISPGEYWDAIPRIMYHMDEPLADPSAVALFFLDEMVAKDVKVVLSGEGADEFFGGYPIYHEPLALASFQKLPRALRRALAAVARIIPFQFRGKSFLDRASKTVEERYIGNGYVFTVAERTRLLKRSDGRSAPSPPPTPSPTPEDLTAPRFAAVRGVDDTARMQYVDYHFWLPGDILLKADKMSMAHSLESRVPFLDREVFGLATTLPLPYRVNDETTKVALRTAALEVLPERIATRPKLGFPVPMRVWLAQDCWYTRVRETFESDVARRFFDSGMLIDLLDEHRGGKADNHRKIWTVYVFLIWYRVFFSDDADEAANEAAPSVIAGANSPPSEGFERLGKQSGGLFSARTGR